MYDVYGVCPSVAWYCVMSPVLLMVSEGVGVSTGGPYIDCIGA